VDPATGKVRTIPMEIRAKGEVMPRYGQTFDQMGLWDVEPALPFSAEGTVAMARYPDDPNSASSQFFIFMAEPDLTPAGLNLMDGRYAVFGYVTEGTEVLRHIKVGDRILSARLISGQDNLKTGA
jgi:peptidylprolyl isomerase